jgi:hypothetical protein
MTYVQIYFTFVITYVKAFLTPTPSARRISITTVLMSIAIRYKYVSMGHITFLTLTLGWKGQTLLPNSQKCVF